jgi:hypothetical protein
VSRAKSLVLLVPVAQIIGFQPMDPIGQFQSQSKRIGINERSATAFSASLKIFATSQEGQSLKRLSHLGLLTFEHAKFIANQRDKSFVFENIMGAQTFWDVAPIFAEVITQHET